MRQLIILATIFLGIINGLFAQSNVVQVEYFLDIDAGFGQNTVLDITTPQVDIIDTVMADIPASTAIGYHKLYIRVKDSDDNWSLTVRKNIEVFEPVIENNIVMGEYFIDEDPEFGMASQFEINPEEADIEQVFLAQIPATLSLGYHKLYGRVQDSYGNWSHTFRKNIEVYLNPDTNVVAVEYFFEEDSDPEFGNNSEVLDEPDMDGTWTFNVPYADSDYNFDDVLFVRVMDSSGKWSITTILNEIALSVGENLYKVVQISPNSFTDSINIEVSESLTFETIVIYDITGKEVYHTTKDLRKLELENLESGIYILSLETETQKATFKIVKE